MPHLGKIGHSTDHIFISLGLVSVFQSSSHYGKKTRSNACRQCLRRQVGPQSPEGPFPAATTIPYASYMHRDLLSPAQSTPQWAVSGQSCVTPMFPRRPSVDQRYHTTPFCPGQNFHSNATTSSYVPAVPPAPHLLPQHPAGSATPAVRTQPCPWQCRAPVGPDLASLL